MGKPNFSDEFKRDAVAQITERGYPVAEVSQRLGVSQHSLYRHIPECHITRSTGLVKVKRWGMGHDTC